LQFYAEIELQRQINFPEHASMPTQTSVPSKRSQGTSKESRKRKRSEDEKTTRRQPRWKKHKTVTVTNKIAACVICFEAIKEQGIIDSCNHIFCFDCIDKWRKYSTRCPVCKERYSSFKRKNLKSGKVSRRKWVQQKDLPGDFGMDPDDFDFEEWLDDDFSDDSEYWSDY
jgi:hypothetical protein